MKEIYQTETAEELTARMRRELEERRALLRTKSLFHEEHKKAAIAYNALWHGRDNSCSKMFLANYRLAVKATNRGRQAADFDIDPKRFERFLEHQILRYNDALVIAQTFGVTVDDMMFETLTELQIRSKMILASA